MSGKLYYDRLTEQMREVERRPLLDHLFAQDSNANFALELDRRVAELERRGA